METENLRQFWSTVKGSGTDKHSLLFSHLEVPDRKKKKHGNDFKRLDSLSEFDISSFL